MTSDGANLHGGKSPLSLPFPGGGQDPISNTITSFLGQVASTRGASAPVNTSHVPLATQISSFSVAAAEDFNLRPGSAREARWLSPTKEGGRTEAKQEVPAQGAGRGDLQPHGTHVAQPDEPASTGPPDESAHAASSNGADGTQQTEEEALQGGRVGGASASDLRQIGAREGQTSGAGGQAIRRTGLGPVSHRRMLGDTLAPAPAPGPNAGSDEDDEDEDPEVAVPWANFHPTLKVRTSDPSLGP